MSGQTRIWAAAAILAGVVAGPAFADVTGFLGTWSNPNRENGGIINGLFGSNRDTSDILRLEIAPAGANHVRIHLYGRCASTQCDWGAQVGHNHSGDPDSDEVQSISADFQTGFGVKHLTLRKGPGNSLRFEIVTDFSDHSGRHDFETGGSLAPVATARNGPASPVAAEPNVPAPGAGVAVDTEDCVRINPEDVYVSPGDRGWSVNDFDHVILNFGSDKVAAVKASRVMTFYRFDEQCYVARPHPKMIYWRSNGQVPHDPMAGQECVAVNAAAVKTVAGKVMDGDRVLVDFDGNDADAHRAASVIRNYKLNRQCFVAQAMVYWLSQ